MQLFVLTARDCPFRFPGQPPADLHGFADRVTRLSLTAWMLHLLSSLLNSDSGAARGNASSLKFLEVQVTMLLLDQKWWALEGPRATRSSAKDLSSDLAARTSSCHDYFSHQTQLLAPNSMLLLCRCILMALRAFRFICSELCSATRQRAYWAPSRWTGCTRAAMVWTAQGAFSLLTARGALSLDHVNDRMCGRTWSLCWALSASGSAFRASATAPGRSMRTSSSSWHCCSDTRRPETRSNFTA